MKINSLNDFTFKKDRVTGFKGMRDGWIAINKNTGTALTHFGNRVETFTKKGMAEAVQKVIDFQCLTVLAESTCPEGHTVERWRGILSCEKSPLEQKKMGLQLSLGQVTVEGEDLRRFIRWARSV